MMELVPTAKKYLQLNVPIHVDKPTGCDDSFLELLSEAKKKESPSSWAICTVIIPAISIADKYIKDNKIGRICQMDAICWTSFCVLWANPRQCIPS